MEGKMMQTWSQSIKKQWNNWKKTTEKEGEWKDKINHTDWSSGARCAMGPESWREKSVAWAGCLGRGSFRWLLGSKGTHIVKVADGC